MYMLKSLYAHISACTTNGYITMIMMLFFSHAYSQKEIKVKWKNQSILVYTKNGKGYVHDNIPFAVACVQKLGKEKGFSVEVSNDPSIFNEANLKKYRFLVFTSTNNDVFDSDDQRLAFRRYIEAGGGYLGVHSAIGTERNWTWFKQLSGGVFSWHPHFQKLTLVKIDKAHPTTFGVPDTWEKEDECYFVKEMYPGIHTILAHDIQNLVTKDEAEKNNLTKHTATFGRLYPATWYQKYDGGLAFMTMLGHDKADYVEPTFINHLYQGMVFLHKNLGKLDYTKAYALSKDDVVK
jgi:uncharacterized protein